MCRNITSTHLPVKSAVWQEVQQFTTRYIVLCIHQVEVALQRIHDDAVWHTDHLDLFRRREAVAHQLMSTNVDDAVGDGICHRQFTPLRAVEVERVAARLLMVALVLVLLMQRGLLATLKLGIS